MRFILRGISKYVNKLIGSEKSNRQKEIMHYLNNWDALHQKFNIPAKCEILGVGLWILGFWVW